MRLSRLLVLTDRTQCAGKLADAVAAAVEYGARTVVLREKDLPPGVRRGLAAELRSIVDPVGGTLVVAGLSQAGDSGPAVHLAAAEPWPAPRPELVGRSCHCLAEVSQARAEGCDYVTVSPVFASTSKPGYGPALGLRALAELCRVAPAAYALAGVLPDGVPGCRHAGAYGVAVMGPVMRDPAIVAAYLAALTEVYV